MRTTDPYEFIHVGLMVRLLRHDGGNLSVEGVLAEGRKLMKKLADIEFPVSVAAANYSDYCLGTFITSVESEPDKKRRLTSSEVQRLSNIMSSLEDVVFAEATTKRLYLISETRFNLDALLHKPARMFTGDAFPRLPTIARQDIAAGFQCLAFDQPTATAFHLLRATEAVLKGYYLRRVKRNRIETADVG